MGRYSDAAPKLIGCYEAALHPFLANVSAAGYRNVVNIGCAEGFYAIGLGRLLPDAHVHAFDIDPAALIACKQTAQLNRLADRITVGGVCDERTLRELLADGQRALLVLDCEGAELDILSEGIGRALRNADILIECHDFVRAGATEILTRRLQDTHAITLISDCGRNPNEIPALHKWPELDRWLAVCEFRPEVMNWLWCASRATDRR